MNQKLEALSHDKKTLDIEKNIKLISSKKIITSTDISLIIKMAYEVIDSYKETNDESIIKNLVNHLYKYNKLKLKSDKINALITATINDIFKDNLEKKPENEEEVTKKIIKSYKEKLNDKNYIYMNLSLSKLDLKRKVIQRISDEKSSEFYSLILTASNKQSSYEDKKITFEKIESIVKNTNTNSNDPFYPQYCVVLAQAHNPALHIETTLDKNATLAKKFYALSIDNFQNTLPLDQKLIEKYSYENIEKFGFYLDTCIEFSKLLIQENEFEESIVLVKNALTIFNKNAQYATLVSNEIAQLYLLVARAHILKSEFSLDDNDRNRCLTSANIFLRESLKKAPSADAYHSYAITHILLDTKLKLQRSHDDKIKLSFSPIDILTYQPEKDGVYQYPTHVQKYLEESDKASANALMAMFYLTGFYFEKDIKKASKYEEKFSKMSNNPLIGFKSRLFFHEYLKEESNYKKIQHLSSFLIYRLIDQKTLDDKNTAVIENNYANIVQENYKKNDLLTEHSFYTKINDVTDQMTWLLTTEININNKKAFLRNAKDISHQIKENFSYEKDDIKKLFILKEKLLANYLIFTNEEQVDLLTSISYWPIYEIFLTKVPFYLDLFHKKTLKNPQFFSGVCSKLILSYRKNKTQQDKKMNEIKEKIYEHLNNSLQDNHKNIANILSGISHSMATFNLEVNNENVSHIITDLFADKISFLIGEFEKSMPYLNDISSSKCYHAITYLKCIYNLTLSQKTTEFLEEFSESHKKNIHISKQQDDIHAVLLKIKPDVEHEAFVGGRSIDFYLPATREIIQFNGPTHYLYNEEGEPVELNHSSMLSQKTLEAQGYTVIHISYLEWNSAQTDEARERLLREKIPSCHRQEIAPSSSVKILTRQDSKNFWKSLKMGSEAFQAFKKSDKHQTAPSCP